MPTFMQWAFAKPAEPIRDSRQEFTEFTGVGSGVLSKIEVIAEFHDPETHSSAE